MTEVVRAEVSDRAGKREEEILTTALDLFFERGFRAVGLRDLTDALGLNVATLYHYFRSKDQILLRLQMDGMQILLERAAKTSEESKGASPSVRLESLLRMHLWYHTEHHKTAKLHFSDYRSLAPESQSAVRQLMKRYERFFIDVVSSGIESGEFRPGDSKLIAYGILGSGAYVSYWYRPDGESAADEIVESQVGLLLNGVLTG